MSPFTWVLALAVLASGAAPSDSPPAAGTLRGQPFKAAAAELRVLGLNSVKVAGKVEDRAQAYVLEFKDRDVFMADNTIQVWFAVDVGQPLDNLRLDCKPVEFGTEAYRKQHYRSGRGSVARGITGVFATVKRGGSSDTAMVSDNIGATLQFGKASNGWITGAIDLRLSKEHKTVFRGSFKAKIEKFGD
jgi:hypothetical protein